jgi:Golgi nucleoside diphosphatase
VCVVLYMVVGGGGESSGPTTLRYGCMMDAGSTGSRIHIYRFAQRADGSLKLQNEIFKQLKPGVSSFAGQPHKAAESIQPLLDEAIAAVPAELHGTTPIALYATAGLRLLPVEGQSDAILEELRDTLAASPFLFDPKNVAITQGKLEGVFAWTTVNFLLGNLDGHAAGRSETAGIIDLGGGSTQIVFEPVPPNDFDDKLVAQSDTHAMLIGDQTHELFAHSYLGYGLNSAAEKIKNALDVDSKHPCYPRGATISADPGSGSLNLLGGGDAASCAALIKDLIQSKDEQVGMNLVASPSSAGVEWYIFSYFYDRLVEGLSLPSNQALTVDIIEGTADAVCQLSLSEVAEEYPRAESPERFCMDVTFCGVLLRHGCECFRCHTGLAALLQALNDQYSCIVLMPPKFLRCASLTRLR